MSAASFPPWVTFAFGASETAPGGEEGGWNGSDPSPENPTWRGIEYDEWCKWCGAPMTFDGFRASCTRSAIMLYVKPAYWDLVHGDDLPLGVDVLIADHCLNAGPGAARACIRAWQAGLGVDPDGVVGPLTKLAMRGAPNALLTLRDCIEGDYRTKRQWAAYGAGWIARLGRCLTLARKLAGTVPAIS